MVLRFALALAVLGATPVCAADISGFWLTSDGSATVEISRCESDHQRRHIREVVQLIRDQRETARNDPACDLRDGQKGVRWL